jgi:ribonuclease R
MSASAAPDRVFSVLSAAGRPLKAKDVSALLGLSADDRGAVRDTLRGLVEAGRVVQLEGRRFAVVGAAVASPGGPEGARASTSRGGGGVPGVVQRKASGVGWFVPDDKTMKDAFLPPSELKAAMDGDRVLARIERGTRGPTATIVRTVSRGRTSVTGQLRTSHDRRFGRSAWVEVDDNLITGPVQILDDAPGGPDPDVAVDGDVVEVQIVSPPTAMHAATGRILRRIGRRGELDTEIERLVVQAGVVRAFPPDALADAGQLGDDPGDDDIEGRLDLRDLAIVTIDGETAKDFDDAVFASQKKRAKKIDVVVCVADVSHYVTGDGALDREARRRSTSIYYPGRVIPMLPEALSNGLCSLKPRVPRLCAVVRFSVDEDGNVADERFDFGVMKSRARLTYSLVQRFLDEEDGKQDPYAVPPQPKEATATTAALDDEVRESLRLLRQAALRIRKNRQDRGALDFELPELVIELDPRREPVGIKPLQRAFAHKLIEDLMIAANEASARFFDERKLPSVYRIHELPDDEKLGRFLGLAGPAYALATGKQLPRSLLEDPSQPSALMAVMNALGDHPMRTALDMLLLRSMKQARYSVDNVGHYGLGSQAYLHFTSPIRRYPDLVVHRLLRDRLGGKKAKKAKKRRDEDVDPDDALLSDLEDIATTASEQERKASDLERSIQALHSCWLMKDRVGETHAAIVTGVSEAGAFVRLTELFVEGLVRIAELGSEYYAYDETRLMLRGERSGELITLGTRFDVEVANVDFSRRQISFVRPRVDADARHRHDRLAGFTRWEPRTDARSNGSPGAQGRRRDHVDVDEPRHQRGGHGARGGHGPQGGRAAYDERRGPHAGQRGDRRDGRREGPRDGPHDGRRDGPRGAHHEERRGPGRAEVRGGRRAQHEQPRAAHQPRGVDDALRGEGQGRNARFARYADDAAVGPRAAARADRSKAEPPRRPPPPAERPDDGERDEIDERLARWRAVAADDRAITRDRRQERYERQHRGARDVRPDVNAEHRGDDTGDRRERARPEKHERPSHHERPKLRGPDDLRALAESRGAANGGAHDDDQSGAKRGKGAGKRSGVSGDRRPKSKKAKPSTSSKKPRKPK